MCTRWKKECDGFKASSIAFAKAKEKGIVRSMTFLINNELLNSFSFVPFPADADHIRKTVLFESLLYLD